MLTITRDGNGYKVAASAPGTGWRGFSVHAKNIEEIGECVEHFYRPSGAAGLPHSNSAVPDCPMCADTRRKAAKH